MTMALFRIDRQSWLPRGLAATLTFSAMVLACAPDAGSPDPAADREAAVPVAQDVYPIPDGAWDVHTSDFAAMMQRAGELGIDDQPHPLRMVEFGRMFIGLPYVAQTLDVPGPERLVVNLKELDCVTLVENALALSFASAAGGEYAEFLRALEHVRYREGRLEGYTSRLHYFTDWIADNQSKGVLRDVTLELGGEPATKQIGFMSSNRNAYRQLRENPALVDSIRQVETILNQRRWHWIPQERIKDAAPGIQEGDIIGITTAIAGLDVSHTGLATWVDGRLHLLHAPDVGHPVEITAQPLAQRILANRLQNGIVVARPITDTLRGSR